ncbi:hypothetical protein [Bacteroides sp.]|uniref:hypothetical protein n=1 Tax=Bacteroides sp. TaxID=29523 RepID=UPI002631C688|nr:hypothetical protein [Bacteroides sp.]MDD3041016.1 hypothetical protein [Bacteroides sp.]
MKAIVIAQASQQPYIGICHHSGGIPINGKQFLYIPYRDILIRQDWVKFYNSLPYEEFIKAVETGVKPELAKKSKKKKVELPSLF